MAYDDRDDDDDGDVDVRKSKRGGGGGDVPNYLVQAILVTLCCCIPFGIVAIIQATKVNTHLAKGEHELAVKASDDAKKWCMIGAISGVIANVIIIGLQIMAGAMSGVR